MTDNTFLRTTVRDNEFLIRRGKQIAESGEHVRPRGKYLGVIEALNLPVYEGSPQPWIDALLAEELASGAE